MRPRTNYERRALERLARDFRGGKCRFTVEWLNLYGAAVTERNATRDVRALLRVVKR